MIGPLASHLWQSTLFALAAALLALAFRHNRAHVRFGLWLSASLKFLLPFSLLFSLGGRLAWMPAARQIAAPQVSMAVERIAQPFVEARFVTAAAPAPVDWMRTIVWAVWISGLLAVVVIRLRLWLRVRSAVREATALEIPAAVEVRSAPGLLEPGVVGWLHPILLLPEGILDCLTPSQFEAVLAHELCHVRRRDNLFASLHMLVEALFWFHPLVWWIGRRMVEERERACDEGVLSLGNQPRVYADAILNVCKLYVESPLPCVAGVTGADLRRRIEAIMLNHTGRGLSGARKALLASAAAAALAVPVAVGALIGAAHTPVLHAQPLPPAPLPQRAAQPDQAAAREPQQTSATTPETRMGEWRLLTILMEMDSLTPDEQSRARATALDVVHRMQPNDLTSVMKSDNGGLSVVEDFTRDQTALTSAIGAASAPSGNAAPSETTRLATLATATRMLGRLEGKKSLMYFSGSAERGQPQDSAQVQEVINQAQRSNVAFYSVDTSSASAQVSAGRPMQSAPAGLSQEEYNHRRDFAQANYGPANSQRSRIYIRYGPPDTIDTRSDRNSPVEVWRYQYLDNFHSAVEFEFDTGRRMGGVHINWPPPLATFVGTPASVAVDALARQLGPVPATPPAPLPNRHMSLGAYPAGEAQTVTVPLDSLSGVIDIIGEIKSKPASGISMNAVANFRDHARIGTAATAKGEYQATFNLPAGSYTCLVLVKEEATGNLYAESIDFEIH